MQNTLSLSSATYLQSSATYKTIISCIQRLQEYGKTKLWLKCAWTYFGERAKENFCRIMAITNFASNIAKF
uniref:Uncharacterized protein n=1 Tax=Oryza punctata TaxID=4537 RepID=A0A0E0KE75_ORYPU